MAEQLIREHLIREHLIQEIDKRKGRKVRPGNVAWLFYFKIFSFALMADPCV